MPGTGVIEADVINSTQVSHGTPTTERRCWVRYPCNQAAFSRSLFPEEYIFWTARARDISRGGLSLDLSQRFEPGTVLAVEVLSTNQTSARALHVRVIHLREQEGGSWRVGCEFLDILSDDDLHAIL
jgi:hypothetical protein